MRSARSCFGLLAIVLVCVACPIGPSPRSLDRAPSALGAQASLKYGSGGNQHHRGELVAVRDDGLLLLLPEGLTLVHFTAISTATFSETVGVGRLVGAGTERQRRNLAGFARYPFGLVGDQLGVVLASLRQDRLIEVRQ